MGAICRKLRRISGNAGGGVATFGSSRTSGALSRGGNGTGGGFREGLARVFGGVVGINLGETAGICRGMAVGSITMGVRDIALVGGFVVACWKMMSNCYRASICFFLILENGTTGAGCWRA